MSNSDDELNFTQQFAAENGAEVNQSNGIYVRGQRYSFAKKLEVAAKFRLASRRAQRQGKKVKIAVVTKACGVSRKFMDKIRQELLVHGRVLPPSDVVGSVGQVRGAGVRSLDQFDRFVLLQLRTEEPSRSLSSYVHWLHEYTGTVVSKSTVSRFFLTAFKYKGSLVKPNKVPYDKFRPENEGRAYEFIYMLSNFAPERVKFGNEKSLKGQELYNRKVRVDPETGVAPPVVTGQDYKNTHSITRFCGIDGRMIPIWYCIRDATNDSEIFLSDVEAAIQDGFLRRRDILVLDNVSYHSKKHAAVLAEWLWRRFSIFVLYLPPRTPEWNPIELLWAYLTKRLGTYPLSVIREEMQNRNCKVDAVSHVANKILREIDHDLVRKCYNHCFKGEIVQWV